MSWTRRSATSREATRLKPDEHMAYNGLAWALAVSSKRPRPNYDEALCIPARRSAHAGL